MKTYLCQRSYSLQNTKWSQISNHFSSFLRNLQHTLIVNSRISVVLFIPTHSSCPETWILWQSESLRPLNAVHSKLSSSIASIVTGVLDVGYVQSLTVIFHLNSLYEYHHAPMTTRNYDSFYISNVKVKSRRLPKLFFIKYSSETIQR